MTASEEMHVVKAEWFEDWRTTARHLLGCGLAPEMIRWVDVRSSSRAGQGELFAETSIPRRPSRRRNSAPADDALSGSQLSTPTLHTVPQSFVDLAKTVSHHRSPTRWSLLYRLLWRITGGEMHLMKIDSDRDLHEARTMEKGIRRDVHKMKAFVRFRQIQDEVGERYVAWHRPDHYIVRLAAPFFARRFDVMRWSILTPDESVHWDGATLDFQPGVPRNEAPSHDELESLWKTYYANIFNPARIKLKAMQAEMPKKHWATLPETELIDSLIRDAPARVENMIKQSEGTVTAKAYLPPSSHPSIDQLRDAAQVCRGCDLHQHATQTVFGQGSPKAKLIMIGEQPGDQEDLAGEPFVGPAGQLLREVMEEVELSVDDVYITNAVKHFKFRDTGSRRLHVKPSSREIAACRPWLTHEIEAIRPPMLLCLGATAAGVVLGPTFRITKDRGVVMRSDYSKWTMATYHPSALLRVPDKAARERMRQMFTHDLRQTAEHLKMLSTN